MTSSGALIAIGTLLVLGAFVYMNYEAPNSIDHTFTSDFNSFLKSNYGTYNFDRTDVTWSCYG